MQRGDIFTDAMRRALAIARRGPAHDSNPQVGCVILNDEGRILAEGWHLGAGTPHAEIEALQHLPAEWRERPRDLTAVVTLEPCNHFGRTGPCAEALARFGIGTVVYGLDDPGAVSSGGADTLRAAGVEVRSGLLADEIRDQLADWIAAHGGPPGAGITAASPGEAVRSGADRPFVIVKWAQSLDGRAAADDGTSQWITGAEARADVHRRRAAADAILVGTGTLLADDPALTARTPAGDLLVPAAEQPVPVIVGRRAIPEGARVLQHPAFRDPNGITEPIALAGDDLRADLAHLGRIGIRSVFVEGGPAIVSSLISAGLVDELLVYVAPALLGGDRLAIGDIGVRGIGEMHRLRPIDLRWYGPDLLLRLAPLTPSIEETPCSPD